MGQSSTLSGEILSQYLIAEFESLQSRAIQAEQIIASRTNFFIVMLTGLVGAIIVLVQNIMTVGYGVFFLIIFIADLALLIVGLLTLIQNADISGSTVILYRRIGRIRRWFADHHSGIVTYLPFEASDDRPFFTMLYPTFRSSEPILVLVNAITVSIMLCYIVYWSSNIRSLLPFVSFGVISFSATIWLEFKLILLRLSSIEKEEMIEGRIHFPGSLT